MGTEDGNGFGHGWFSTGDGRGPRLAGGLDGNGYSQPLMETPSWQYWVGTYGYAGPQTTQDGTGSLDWSY